MDLEGVTNTVGTVEDSRSYTHFERVDKEGRVQ